MDIDNALNLLVETYGINKDKIIQFLNENKSVKINNIILPYCGIIYEDRCKGIVFNKGLYTQCTEKCANKCKTCEKNKYGSIYDRKNYPLGEFKCISGKKELNYNSFIKKMNYNIDDVINAFRLNGIDHTKFLELKKSKGRGRPRKDDIKNEDNNTETIEVVKVIIDGCEYLKTKENVLLDNKSYEIIGILKDNEIIQP